MNQQKNINTVWQNTAISRVDHELQNGHRGSIVWFTGLSGAGKSTLANAVESRLFDMGCHANVLDGDNVRHGLCSDLGFSLQDRTENIRRIGELSKLFMEAGTIILAAFISPNQKDRVSVRNLVSQNDFFEIFCSTPIEVCESRDVKGLYKRARAGEIKDFTGISAAYEVPLNPELVIDTSQLSIQESVDKIINLLCSNGVIERSALERGLIKSKTTLMLERNSYL